MLTDEQIAERLKFITGSDAAVIACVSKWATPYSLWRIKTGRQLQSDLSDNQYVLAGSMLESAVVKWFVAVTGKEVIESNKLLIHKTEPWMAGTLDGRIKGESAILECKTASGDKDWGDRGTDQIPLQYLYQVRHYIAVADVDRCYVAVLIRGVDFRIYCVERDRAFERGMILEERLFWNSVQNDTPPPAVTREDVIDQLDGRVSDAPLIVGSDIVQKVDSLAYVNDQIKELERYASRLKDDLCIYMGEYQVLSLNDGTPIATWKPSKPPQRFNHIKFREEHPELYKQYVKQGKATRSFVIKREKKHESI